MKSPYDTTTEADLDAAWSEVERLLAVRNAAYDACRNSYDAATQSVTQETLDAAAEAQARYTEAQNAAHRLQDCYIQEGVQFFLTPDATMTDAVTRCCHCKHDIITHHTDRGDKTMDFAEQMIKTLTERGIEPDYTFDASAGRDYGYIRAWDIAGGGQAVESGNNAETDYGIVDSGDFGDFDGDAALEILSPDDRSPLTIGTLLGIGAVREAKPDDPGPFAVLSSTDYYGPTSEVAYAAEDIATYAAAQAWIDSQSGPVYLSHNQASGPNYKIIEM